MCRWYVKHHAKQQLRTIDDSTIYRSCKINQKDTFKKELEVDINSVAKWLFETNLVFKTGKTNIYYLEKKNVGMAWTQRWTHQHLLHWHQARRESQWKLLGITTDENLTLSRHISKILKILFAKT